jgi:hypothetical protein
MSGEPYDLRDPGKLVADVMAEHDLRAGDGLIACVREASTDQELTAVIRISASRWRRLDRPARSRLLAKTAQCLPIPSSEPGRAPTHSIVTVLARRGYAVLGRSEGEWAIAWHYSNHLVHAYCADLILVTEHGWIDFMSGWGDREPSLALHEAA